MSVVAFIDLAQLVADAGFPGGEPQANTVAIVTCESGRDSAFRHQITGDPAKNPAVGSWDRGLCAINSYWHPEVSDACADDPVCALREMLRITNRGTDFSPFGCWTSGTYRNHLEAARVALDGADRQRRLKAQLAGCQAQLVAANKTIGDVQNQLAGCQATNSQLGSEVADLQIQLDAEVALSVGLQAKIDAAKAALG